MVKCRATSVAKNLFKVKCMEVSDTNEDVLEGQKRVPREVLLCIALSHHSAPIHLQCTVAKDLH